ncbi:MAG: aminotransferase class I/II-fold pyridoxal phosphate-dependent enzyme [Bradyrhizobium sp.]|nr:aminotransferase class I/II-fold pyridoxal phosphate-dependent enzyme [Bradyrhizobium sp.]
MTDPSDGDQDARQRLMTRVQSMRRAPEATSRDLGDPTDFSSLPGFEELRVQRAVGNRLGLENPYFKLHEGRAGSHTLIGNRDLINFSCYDYLGLNGHPEILEAAQNAIRRFGVSCSASRVVAGERQVHRDLEQGLAKHYAADDAVVMVSGYATNLGVIGQLAGPKDLIVYDAVSHNSVVMGSVLSGATRRSFAHNDLDNLEEILTANRAKYHRVLVIVEGLYSMDGDYPNLPRLIDIKRRHQAWLMVDEAHGLGVLGARGGGVAEHFGVDPRDVDIWMGTLSKTLAGCGGYIAGSAVLVDYLRSLCNAFVYSVGMPPVIAASAAKALEIMQREPERVERLQRNSRYFQTGAQARGMNTGTAPGTAVCPIIVGDSVAVAYLSQRMFDRGINVQPVLYPAVPAKTSRLRFFLTAMHSEADMDTALSVLHEELVALPEAMAKLTSSDGHR